MKKPNLLIAALMLLVFHVSSIFAQSTKKIESIYADLVTDKCKTVELDEMGSGYYRGECPGIGGYKLELIESDIRQTIDVIFPNGKKHELNFGKVVSYSFSYTGKKAEWRVVKKDGKIEPIALIVRYNFAVNPAISSEEASYLTVTKITKKTACVTNIVKSVKDQNVKARQLADSSANKPCLENKSSAQER